MSAAAARIVFPAKRRQHPAPAPGALFRAFADPTRLRILHLLQGREVCVGDLVRALRVPQPTASRHLAFLRRAALVTARKDGLWVHYSLAPPRGALHRRVLACLDDCAAGLRAIAADERRFARIVRAGGCCPSPRSNARRAR